MSPKIIKVYLLIFIVLLVLTIGSNMTAFLDPVVGSISGIEIIDRSKEINTDVVSQPPLGPIIYDQNLHLPILMYHHIGVVVDPNDSGAYDLTVSPEDFEKQVEFFRNQGFNSVSVKQAYEAMINGLSLPEKPIIFTFDDGYQDFFVNALPILKKYGFTASLAIATELLGRPAYANWGEVIAAGKEGNEILSHSENHLDLTSSIYSNADLEREIFGSKKILEEKLGTSIAFFIYPYGKYNQKIIELVSQAGYKMALTTGYSMQINKNGLFTVGRVRVHGQNGLEKLKKIFDRTEQSGFVSSGL